MQRRTIGILLVLSLVVIAMVGPGAAAPVPSAGTLIVNSVPAGASVKLDGKDAGITPLTLSVPSGTHRLALTLDGYKNYGLITKIWAGETTIVSVKLVPVFTPKTGTLLVESVPSGASVKLDGKDVGKTPLDPLIVSAGSHKLIFTLTGYKVLSKTVTIKAGQTTTVKAKLVPS
jgi:PPM family protein phosphatase